MTPDEPEIVEKTVAQGRATQVVLSGLLCGLKSERSGQDAEGR